MSTPTSLAGRAARWMFHSVRRLVRIVLGFVAVAATLVLALAWAPSKTGADLAETQAARKTCAGAVAGFSVEFFNPAAPDWAKRVSPWVERQVRAQIAGIDPAVVPAGPVNVTGVVDDTASCDAVVVVHTQDGDLTVDVVAQRGGVGEAPDWVVVEWAERIKR